jgi:predicted amidohydrolase
MKISVAQTRPTKGDIQSNILSHKKLIDLAVSNKADIVIFPELSLTGYEPHLAKHLATDSGDMRLNDFQSISDSKQIVIGVGIPTKNSSGVCISMLIFQPDQPRKVYSKKYLHADEEPFFISGDNFPALNLKHTSIALAICYEISVPEHTVTACGSGAEIYIASVAKSLQGIEKALERLTHIAADNGMTVLMSNSIGPADDFIGAGKSSVWDNQGSLLGQLDGEREGLLILDTKSNQVKKIAL